MQVCNALEMEFMHLEKVSQVCKKGNQKKVKVSQVSKFKQIDHGRGISEHA